MSRRKYPDELRERAVRMFGEFRDQHGSEWAAVRAVAELLERSHRTSFRMSAGDTTSAVSMAWMRARSLGLLRAAKVNLQK
ncbi:hypothetical protein [Nocardia jiangxiensis]|uniref:hypothetical protein n=1 Tax=Nocardia jiangxiensis TaxID=282685 RepID=UPI000687D048|nr:hypothetical protein [Nocardia jiangxiensis]